MGGTAMGLLYSFSTALLPSFAFPLTTLVPSQKPPSNNPHSSQKDPLGGCAATRVWFTRRVWVVFWERHKAKKPYKTLARRVHLLAAGALWDAACPQHPHVAWGSPGHFGQLESSTSQKQEIIQPEQFIFLTPLHSECSLPSPMVLACSRYNPAHTCSFTGVTPKSLRGCGIYPAQLVFSQQQDKLPGVWQDHTTWHGLLQIRRRWKAMVWSLGWAGRWRMETHPKGRVLLRIKHPRGFRGDGTCTRWGMESCE